MGYVGTVTMGPLGVLFEFGPDPCGSGDLPCSGLGYHTRQLVGWYFEEVASGQS